jgi:hypothetical protein
VIHIRLDTTLDELSCKKEKRNLLGLGYFRAYERFFSFIAADDFSIQHYDFAASYVYYNVASMKIDSMRSRNASIMLSLSLFFSRHLAKERREENEMQKTTEFSLPLSLLLSVSFITSPLFSTRGYYYLYTK